MGINQHLNKRGAASQFYSAVILSILFIGGFAFLMEWWQSNIPSIDGRWGKLGLISTMFGTIFTFFKLFVVHGYLQAGLELENKVEQNELMGFFAQFDSNEKIAKELDIKIKIMTEEIEVLKGSSSAVDKYDRYSVFLGLFIIEVGLTLQLFSK